MLLGNVISMLRFESYEIYVLAWLLNKTFQVFFKQNKLWNEASFLRHQSCWKLGLAASSDYLAPTNPNSDPVWAPEDGLDLFSYILSEAQC